MARSLLIVLSHLSDPVLFEIMYWVSKEIQQYIMSVHASTLLSHQVEHAFRIIQGLTTQNRMLDTSVMGCGKS